MGHKVQGKRITLPMTFNMTSEYSLAEVKEYIQKAIDSWGGQRRPEDELFDHDFNIVFGTTEIVGVPRATSKRRRG